MAAAGCIGAVAFGALLAACELFLMVGLGQPERRLVPVVIGVDLALGLAIGIASRWPRLARDVAPAILAAALLVMMARRALPMPPAAVWIGCTAMAAASVIAAVWPSGNGPRSDRAQALRVAALLGLTLAISWSELLTDPASWALPLAVLCTIAVLALRTPRLVVAVAGLALAASIPWSRQIEWTSHGAAPTADADEPHRNLILITLDTVRADHMSLYGYSAATTPNLEAWSRRGVVFESAYANGTYTLSSHASLFTGLLPSEHGARHAPPQTGDTIVGGFSDFALEPQFETLAESLGARGYRRAAIVANDGYLVPGTGLAQGFEQYAVVGGSTLPYRPLAMGFVQRALAPNLGRPKQAAPTIFRHAWSWIEERHARADPHFLFLNLMDAHQPYDPPPTWRTRFLPAGAPQAGSDWTWAGRFMGRPVPPSDLPTLISLYDGEIAFLDHELGGFLSRLETAGYLRDTIVVITSDHGEMFGEHGFFFHDTDPYEAVIRIPLIVLHPDGTALRSLRRIGLHEVKAMVEALMAGDGLDEHIRGDGNEAVVAEQWLPQQSVHAHPRAPTWLASRSLLAGPHKLLERNGGPSELYDLGADPRETRDLGPALELTQLERIQRLREQLPPVGSGREGSRARSDDEHAEKLRALGYSD